MDQAELQAKIDALRGEEQVLHRGLDGGGVVDVPAETVSLSSPLRLYSGIALRGLGVSSILDAAPNFSGSCLVELRETIDDPSARVSGAAVESLRFRSPAGSGIAAIGVSESEDFLLTNDRLADLYLDTAEGILLDCYSQCCTVERVYSYGPVGTILRMSGNANLVHDIDKEGSATALGDAPYIELSSAGGSTISRVVLEGAWGPGRTGLRMTGCSDTIVENYWCSPPSDVAAIKIVELTTCDGVRFRGKFKTLGSQRRVSLTASRRCVWEQTPNPADLCSLWDCIDIDSDSSVSIEHADNRHGQGLYRAAELGRVRLDDVFHSSIDSEGIAGYVPRDRIHFSPGGGNAFADPGFVGGDPVWLHSGTMTVGFEVSPFGALALRASGIQLGSRRKIYQIVTIPQEMLNSVLTFAVLAKVEGPGTLFPAPGTLVAVEKSYYHRIDSSDGWALVPCTVEAQASGSVAVGWKITGHTADTVVRITRPWLGIGPEAWLG